MNCSYCGSYLGPVSPKERECADLLLEGLQGKDIGKRMGISGRTVKHHMRKLFLKYGITNGVKHVKLAVALYYERNPEKRPFLSPAK